VRIKYKNLMGCPAVVEGLLWALRIIMVRAYAFFALNSYPLTIVMTSLRHKRFSCG
jgi:hypothetical protein